MFVCCTVEEIMNQLEVNLQQKIDERLAEQREIEALDEGRYFSCYGHKSVQCMLVARKRQ